MQWTRQMRYKSDSVVLQQSIRSNESRSYRLPKLTKHMPLNVSETSPALTVADKRN